MTADLTAPPVRLTATDGLLLRAEHLTRMQDYALSLAAGVGRGGGAGVDSGYELTLRVKEGDLVVGPGTARAGSGRPLILSRPTTVPLPQSGETWVVTLVPDESRTAEVDQLIGDLCGDPCDGERATRPYLAEGVRVELVESVPAAPARPEQLRSTLASQYFDRESQRPGAHPGPPADLRAPAFWGVTGVPDTTDRVPIGLLFHSPTGEWGLDVWAARRDRMELPARRWWDEGLGLRPWPVFVAQVLQFQAHQAVTARGINLDEAGFVELPSAGYLAIANERGVEEQVAELFGAAVDPRICTASPAEIATALEQAQHLDRIPLTTADPKDRPRVDILVPDGVVGAGDRPSQVRFASAELTIEDPSTGVSGTATALARAEWRTDGPITFATAGVRAEGKPFAYWCDVWLSTDPTQLEPKDTCSVTVRIAGTPQLDEGGTPPPGGARLRIDLQGTFTCTGRTPDAVGGAILDGTLFGGRSVRRFAASSPSTDDVLNGLATSIAITRSSGLSAVTSSIANKPYAATASGPDGSFPTTVDLKIGQMSFAARLTEDPSAVLAGNEARKQADEALRLLSGTELSGLAPERLFADEAVPGRATSHRTPHNWVLFRRRNQTDCGTQPEDVLPVTLDLYTLALPPGGAPGILDAPDSLESSTAIPINVGQLRWEPHTQRLDAQSTTDLDSWRRANNSATSVVSGALVWFGLRPLRAEFAIGQVLDRMRAPDTTTALRTVEVSGLPKRLGLTPASSGAVLVLLEARIG